jgi:hypothetical protein
MPGKYFAQWKQAGGPGAETSILFLTASTVTIFCRNIYRRLSLPDMGKNRTAATSGMPITLA